MLDDFTILVEALKGHIRVNTDTKAVEIYDEFGVKAVLRNLDEVTYELFKELFVNF